MDPVAELAAVAHAFGRDAASKKLRLLDAVAATPRLSRARSRLLGEVLRFLRAYPDSQQVRARALGLVGRSPPVKTSYAYSYGVLVRLVRMFPRAIEIDWDEVDDDGPLVPALDAILSPVEAQMLEDTEISLDDWLAQAKPDPEMTDLELLLDLFERSALPPAARVALYEACDFPIRYSAAPLAELSWKCDRIHYQRRPIDRSRYPLEPHIRRPLGRPSRGGQALVDLSLQALCARELEIFPLIYADPADATVESCGRGLSIALVGMRPEWRRPLEVLYFFLVLKNGVPIAYGPVSVFGGVCELGINLFPEFRGGEIRYIYAQLMRTLHHRLAVEYFFLTSYAVGVDNDDALASGAFWFYRKLGFKPANPVVEDRAREEEAKMAASPGYRCDRKTLRRLSPTSIYFDLSSGRRQPLPFGAIAMAETRYIATQYAGDRPRAVDSCARRMARLLDLEPTSRALRAVAPLLGALDPAAWSVRDRRGLATMIRAKDGRSEMAAARTSVSQHRLLDALDALGPVSC